MHLYRQKNLSLFALLFMLGLTTIGSPTASFGQGLHEHEQDPITQATPNQDPEEETQFSAQEILTEVLVLRPAGLVGTIVGSAIFVGILPFTTLASIADGDAFKHTGEALVVAPAKFTFTRPLGQYPQDYYAPKKY